MSVKKYFRILSVFMISVCILTGCQSNPEAEARKVVQTYFDAVKAGDFDKAISCATPEIQQEMENALKISGFLSEAIYGQNTNDLMTSFLGISAANEYENYEFKATDVELSDDKNATVIVEVYIDGNINETTKIHAVKYQDKWCIGE